MLFATADGGVSWKPDRVLTGLHEHSEGSDGGVRRGRLDVDHRQSSKDGLPQLTKLGPAPALRIPRCQLRRNRGFRK